MDETDDLSDEELFRSAVQDVRPLRDDRVWHRPRRPKPIPLQARLDEEAVVAELLSDAYEPEALESGEELSYLRPGMQTRVLRRLRRGHYSIATELDLHGLTVPMAREALSRFLAHCRQHNLRCVRIIHGKGRRSSNRGPVLKGKVDHWLRQRSEVLAFCSARPVDGGSGAVYVLLKFD